MLTFGIGYPPLSVLLLVSITLQTLTLQIGIHYHRLQAVNYPELYKVWTKILEIEVTGLEKQLTRTLSLSLMLSTLFILFFILDMTWNLHNTSTYVVLPLLFIIFSMAIIHSIPRYYHNVNWNGLVSPQLIELVSMKPRESIEWPVRMTMVVNESVDNPLNKE